MRADFFRYIVVLKEGGIYSDIDVLCTRSFSSYLRQSDRLVAGFERLMASYEMAHFSKPGTKGPRAMQFLQWTFLAAPGHPALKELCDTIKEWILSDASTSGGTGPGPRFEAYALEHGEDMAVMEFTGPGVWTDVILEHVQHGAEGIRLLPRDAWALGPQEAGASHAGVLHHFKGSWREEQ